MTRYIRARFWTSLLGCALLAGWLAGCSATQLFNEGMSDINAGRLDVGLAKMEDAVKKDPDSSFLKTQLRMTRKYVVQRELQEADAARAAWDFTGARRLYEHVLELDKANAQALAGLESTKNAEMNQLEIRMAKDLIGHNELKEAQAQLGHILSTDPSNIEAKQMLDRILSQSPLPEPVKPKLRLKEDRIAVLQFRESPLGMVFEALSRTSGINFVLDKDVKSEAKTNIFVKDMLIESALDMVLAQHALDRKLLADNIVLIYPYAAGGTEAPWRALVQELSKSLGQPVLLEHRAGAGGRLGVLAVTKAPPDGYLLTAVVDTVLTAVPHASETFKLELGKDYTPVHLTGTAYSIVVASPNVPFSDMKGMLAYAC
ncbi:MAG: hypothetical protein JW395_3833 [Nitrospira sp.]|nr:hypothetical protein [Nitrospira sp.]